MGLGLGFGDRKRDEAGICIWLADAQLHRV